MNITKEQREMLRDEFGKVWGSNTKMVDYCTKKASAFVDLGGLIVTLDKPKIETRFCFGYGMQGAYDYDEAQEVCDALRTNEWYFIDYNLEHSPAGGLMEAIAGYYDGSHRSEPMIDPHEYDCQTPDCKLSALRWADPYRMPREWYEQRGCRPATDEDLATIYKVAYEEQVKFLKRLKTYLKRYGMSKCHFWTYWADE